jgi:hypothetical protein
MSDDGFIVELPPHRATSADEMLEPGEVPVYTHGVDGSVTRTTFTMPPELQTMLEEAREEWKRLKDAGTPYWCIHENRSVSHPSAYWKEDGYFRDDGIEMQYKHGVMCGDCGGYIQEG